MFDVMESTQLDPLDVQSAYPRQGIKRVSFISATDGNAATGLSLRKVKVCYQPDIGYFRNQGPEFVALSQPTQDPATDGQAHVYHAVPVAVWDGNDRGHLYRDLLHHVRVRVWLIDPNTWRHLVHLWEEFPPDRHDVQIHRFTQGWTGSDVRPCSSNIAATVRTKNALVPNAVSAYLLASQSAWERSNRSDHELIPAYTIQQVEARIGLNKAHRAVQEEKRKAEQAQRRAEREARGEATFDGGLNDCPHTNVVANKYHDNGSIDGQCQDCGEEGFPIRDVAYEQMGDPDGPKRRLARLITDLQAEPKLAWRVRKMLVGGR